MSEYQYYEFRAIDRPLTERQIKEVGQYSTRAEISSTRFANEYSFGNFRGDEHEFLEKYFDVLVYYANWGTHRLMMKVPAELVNPEQAARYCTGPSAKLERAGHNLILDFSSSPEEYSEWSEAGQWVADLLPVRDALLNGDERPLYLGWLAGVQSGVYEEDDAEPPVPPGLQHLRGSLKSLAEFLWIEEDLLQAAAELSPALAKGAGEEEFARWLTHLPQAEKDELLIAFCSGPDAHLAGKLRKRFRDLGPQQNAARSGRTVGQLQARAEELRTQREAAEAEQKAAERARRAAEMARQREEHLKQLAGQGDAPWNQVQSLIASKLADSYDQAVQLLVDLHEVSRRNGTEARFAHRMLEVREQHGRKSKFMQKLEQTGLLKNIPQTSA